MKKYIGFIGAALLTLSTSGQEVSADFFKQLKTEKVISNPSVEWKNFGPGMSGYCEEFWCHPTNSNVMFMGPDMHVAYGSWDAGKSWQTIKDSDGFGKGLERVHDIVFSTQNPNFGLALERRGNVFKTNDMGRSWELIYKIPNASKQPYNAHTKMAIHPTNDKVWFIGAGDFWNVKQSQRSKAFPAGKIHPRAKYGYILKTVDGGAHWKKVATNISNDLDVGRIIFSPNNSNNMIIATGQGVFASQDGGDNWKPSNSGLPNNLPKDLSSYYNPDTKEFILYLVEQTVYQDNGNGVKSKGGVFKSTNEGKSWESITGNLGVNLNKISNRATTDRFYKTVGTWFGITKNDAKAKFQEFPDNLLSVYNRIAVNPKNKNEIYLVHNKKHDRGFGPGDVFKTENGGETWFACARNGAYWVSNKDKAYWESIKQPTGANIDFAHLQTYMDHGTESSGTRMLAFNPDGKVFIGIDQQTLTTDDNGKSWYQIDDYETFEGSNKWIGRGDSNLPGRFMLHETGIKNRRLLCSGEHGLWQTTDLGAWPDKQGVAVEQIEGQVHDFNGNHGAHSISTVAVHPNKPNIIYVLAWRQEHRGKLRRSMDGGKSWENISTIFEAKNNSWEGLAMQYSLTIDPENPENMYFCSIRKPISEVGGSIKSNILKKGDFGVYKSTDAGYTWSLSNAGLPEKASVRRIVMDPDNSSIIYACLNKSSGKANSGLYMSKDNAKHWERVNIPSEIDGVNHLFIDRNTKDMYLSCGNKTGDIETGGVWKSTNKGKKWKKFFDAPYVWQTEVSPVNSNIIMVDVPAQVETKFNQFKNPGVYLTQNGGKHWSKINKGLGQPDKIVEIKPDPYNENVIWCSAWGSGWFVGYLNGTTKGWLKQ